MTDTSVILASLDRFIERFGHHEKLMNDHRVATQCQPVATSKPLTNHGNNHSGHSGRPKQESFAGTDHERCDSHPVTAEISGAGTARKVSSLSMVTVARVASPFQIKSLPVAIGKMPMAIVVSPFQISSLRAV